MNKIDRPNANLIKPNYTNQKQKNVFTSAYWGNSIEELRLREIKVEILIFNEWNTHSYEKKRGEIRPWKIDPSK